MESILVTGANGFIGQHIVKQLLDAGNFKVIACGKDISRLPFEVSDRLIYVPMDISDLDQVVTTMQLHAPSIVIHAAAMSQPNDCELNKELCDAVNIDGTANLTSACADLDTYLFFLSTDFVFSGESGPYLEDDERAPLSHYGWTKLRGEEILEQSGIRYAIGRLSFVYGMPVSGKSYNLITKTISLLKDGKEFRVVDDQVRTPTWVNDAAKAIITVCMKQLTGIFHISGNEIMTPYDVACATASYLDLDMSLLSRANSGTFTEPAKRPPVTGFVITKLQNAINFTPTPFNVALKNMFG